MPATKRRARSAARFWSGQLGCRKDKKPAARPRLAVRGLSERATPQKVDGAVRRIATTYEVRGMKAKIESCDAPETGEGAVLGECKIMHNDFGQLTADYRSRG